MAESKNERKHQVIVDMNDFLLEYAAKKIGNKDDLAEIVYKAGKDDLKGLDDLFKDQGEGRLKSYLAVGEGAISDEPSVTDQETAESRAETLTKEAMAYLGKHLQEFDTWKNN